MGDGGNYQTARNCCAVLNQDLGFLMISYRLGFCLIHHEAWLQALLPDKYPPLVSLSSIEIDLPCDETLFVAPDVKSWVSAMMARMYRPKRHLASYLSSLFERPGVPDLSLDPLQTQSTLTLLFAHWRCRASASVHDPSESRPVDVGMAGALLAFEGYFNSSSRLVHLAAAETFLWHLLNMWCASDIVLLETAAGRRGQNEARAALANLADSWVDTPAARRTVLHAAQIYRGVDNASGPTSGTPWSVHHVYGPFHAALVLWIYSILCSLRQPVHGTELPPFRILDPVDWSAVGLAGMKAEAGDSSVPACRFILEGVFEVNALVAFSHSELTCRWALYHPRRAAIFSKSANDCSLDLCFVPRVWCCTVMLAPWQEVCDHHASMDGS